MAEGFHAAMSEWAVCPHCGNEDAGAFWRHVCGTKRLMGMMCSECNTKEYWTDG